MSYDAPAADMPARDMPGLEPTADDLDQLERLTWHETQAHLDRLLREQAELEQQPRGATPVPAVVADLPATDLPELPEWRAA